MLEELLKKCFEEETLTDKSTENIKTAVMSRIEEEKPMKHFKIKPLIIAAAAVVTVTVLAGFTTAVVTGKHVFSFNKGNSIERAFDLNLESRELTIPEEFKSQNGEPCFSDNVDITPSELLEKFGINPPINDNFTEVEDSKPNVEIHSDVDGFTQIGFQYSLYNKTIDKNVFFTAHYYSNTDKMTYNAGTSLLPGEPNEVITLKNGASCMVSASSAVFSYDGAHWEFVADYGYSIPSDYGEMTEDEQMVIINEVIEAMPGIDAVKQVLADMELL